MSHDSSIDRPRACHTLSALADMASHCPAIARTAIRHGDAVVIQTRNSTYRLFATSDGSFLVQGGWFGRASVYPSRVEVAGCSFGGSALWEDVVAAPGLFLEFRNGVRTTRIQKVWVEPAGERCSPN